MMWQITASIYRPLEDPRPATILDKMFKRITRKVIDTRCIVVVAGKLDTLTWIFICRGVNICCFCVIHIHAAIAH